jgi:adenylate cyclase class 2
MRPPPLDTIDPITPIPYASLMSFEVEVKYRTDGHAALAARIVALGGEAEAAFEQEDAYLAHPARDFRQTNEALRLRRVGDSNAITYKGPRHAGPTKTREEIEIAFAEGPAAWDQMLRLFENLGFRRVALVRKTRRPYRVVHHDQPLEVVLDRIEGLGEFAEVEAIAPSAADLPAAQAAVLDLAGALGLTEVEPRSYLGMILEQIGERPPR